MKNTILLLFFTLIVFGVEAKIVNTTKAVKVAEKWMKINDYGEKEVMNVLIEGDLKDPDFYIINFLDGGFVVVSGDDKANPILAYNNIGFLELEPDTSLTWAIFKSYKEKIRHLKVHKSEEKNVKTKKKWDLILNDTIPKSTRKGAYPDVSPLFETYNTSRWATWQGYEDELPGQDGTNSCVPLSMSQICKFHRFPKQGSGTNSYYVGSNYCYIDYDDHIYNYDKMPFRLTYCGNGEENCNEGSFDFLPEITEENKTEISSLIYHIGLGVEMKWNHYTTTSGTSNNPSNWADVFVDNLGYKSTINHWTNSEIYADPSGFKDELRANLNNLQPVHFRTGGHAVVLDGVENDDYFHFAYGRGGYTDGYYFLYTADDDGIHVDLPNGTNYDALTDIEPDYENLSSDISYGLTISGSTTMAIHTTNSVTISSLIESGADVGIYSKNIVLSAGFKIEKGAQVYIKTED